MLPRDFHKLFTVIKRITWENLKMRGYGACICESGDDTLGLATDARS